MQARSCARKFETNVVQLMLVFFLIPQLSVFAHGGTPAADYLPLRVGMRWVLRSPAAATPIVLQVVGKRGRSYELKFDNPWINSVLLLEPQGGKYVLTGLKMGGHTAPASNDVYYDFTARDGQEWKNSIGTLTLISHRKTVKTRTHTYTDCVEIEEVNSQGNRLYWFFAPGIGFVQFGEGRQAFVLDERASDQASIPETSEASPLGSAEPEILPPTRTGSTLIAVAANPSPNESYTPKTVQARFDQVLRAGVTYVYLSPKWNQLEPRPRHYQFKDLDFQIGEAVRTGLPLICNVRVVDTNQRAMPSDLARLSFRDPQVIARFAALLQALLPRMQGKLHYMLIGNEVDGYFKEHPNEVDDYGDFYRAAVSAVRKIDPGMPVSVSTTFDGLPLTGTLLKPIVQQTNFLALTYYPLRPDFTVNDPRDVRSDFDQIIRTARGRKILLQEVGYPSSPLNNSSQEKQAAMYKAVFQQLRAHEGEFIGANFVFLSDLSDSVVNTLAKYYNLPNADRFKAFLQTLGMIDGQGRPKKSWGVFEEQALLMKAGKTGPK